MDVKLPPLGEGTDSGTVVTILVKEGDQITAGQSLVEIETGKAVAPVPSSAAGKVTKIHVVEGSKISVGQKILSLADDAAPAPAVEAKPVAAAKSQTKPATSRKTVVPTPSPVAEASPEEPSEEFEHAGSAPPPAAPSIRRIARQLGLDLRRVRGTADGGRILMDDLKTYIQGLQARVAKPSPAPTTTTAPAAEPLNFARWGQVSRRPLTPLRKIISQRMVENWNTIPHVTQFDEIDITHVMALRKKFSEDFEKQGARLTLTPFAIKAVVTALRRPFA